MGDRCDYKIPRELIIKFYYTAMNMPGIKGTITRVRISSIEK